MILGEEKLRCIIEHINSYVTFAEAARLRGTSITLND